MKLQTIVAILLAPIFVACASHKLPPAPVEDPVAEVRALHEKFITAFNAHDPIALSAFYAKDTQPTLFPPDELAARGSQEIHDCFASIGKEMPGATLRLTEENFRPFGDGMASWGLWEMKVPTKAKKPPVTMVGRYSEIWIRENGKFVLLSDHASAPLPKPKALIAKRSGPKAQS